MNQENDDFIEIEIRAVMGIGAADSFYHVKVPKQTPLTGKLECPEGKPIISQEYSNFPTVYLDKEEGTDFIDDINKPSIEHAAIWIPARSEWVGVEVQRTKIYEGSWQGFDEILECRGPLKLVPEFGLAILKAYESQKSMDLDEVLRTDPSEL